MSPWLVTTSSGSCVMPRWGQEGQDTAGYKELMLRGAGKITTLNRQNLLSAPSHLLNGFTAELDLICTRTSLWAHWGHCPQCCPHRTSNTLSSSPIFLLSLLTQPWMWIPRRCTRFRDHFSLPTIPFHWEIGFFHLSLPSLPHLLTPTLQHPGSFKGSLKEMAELWRNSEGKKTEKKKERKKKSKEKKELLFFES